MKILFSCCDYQTVLSKLGLQYPQKLLEHTEVEEKPAQIKCRNLHCVLLMIR